MASFFIVGVGRSGTSLLQSMLSSHSKIAIPPETGFVRYNILSWEKCTGLHRKEFLEKNDKLERLKGIFEDKEEEKCKTEIDFYTALSQNYLESKDKSIAGDKDPRMVEFIASVSMLFKDAKFIHLVRDPRDVLLSKKRAAWSKGKPDWYHIFANYVQLKMGEQQGKKLPEDQYLSITYENLLAAPKSTIEEICLFLGVEFEQGMLAFQEKAKELVAEEEKPWKKETMGPLLKDNTDKWKGRLSHWEVALTEQLCEQAFSLGGYEFSNAYNNLSLFQKVTVSITARLLQLLGIFYIPYRQYSQKLLLAWKY